MSLNTLFQDIPIGTCVIKRDRKNLRILFCNPILMAMIGFDHFEDLQGQNVEDVWPGEDIKELAKKLKSPSPPPNAVLSFENKVTGKKQWVKLLIQDSEQTYTLWAIDISENKEEEERLEKAVEKADATSEMKSNFLATMSHEIRTPMQSIYGLLELIELEQPGEDILNMVQTAKDSSSGLLEILDDILDFAKMEAEKMELDMLEVPVRTLARGIIEAMSVKVHGKHVDLHDDISEDVPFVIVGDPKRLRQIIINLMSNAMKFTHEGAVTIKIQKGGKILPDPKKGLILRFEVNDTGIGMSEEVANRLFQVFTQADSSTSRKYGGTGLGLSICKKLVTLMGGEIGVESVEGQGSTFWFEIPTEEVSTEANILEMPKLNGISVLSVEDHPQGAKEIARSLESMGANVESCPTVEEAISLVKRRPFDVGIIDQGLPDGLGLDLIREIVEIRPFMGLIMYTVRDDAGLQHSLQSLGVTYLTKPASRIGLGEEVKNAANKVKKTDLSGPRKILIAEDTKSVQDVLSRQLKSLNVDAKIVENGAEALKALEEEDFGILITDLHMPEVDGYQVVKTIREKEKKKESAEHFPVLCLTADVQMAQRQVYMSYGFDECLLKPVSLGQFRRLLIRWGVLQHEEEPVLAHDEDASANTRGEEKTEDMPVDTRALKELMGGFDDSTIEMLGMFVDMTESLIKDIKKNGKDKNLDALKENAHSLKGGARSACATRLGDLASDLQDRLEDNKDPEDLPEKIVQEFDIVRDYIKAMKT